MKHGSSAGSALLPILCLLFFGCADNPVGIPIDEASRSGLVSDDSTLAAGSIATLRWGNFAPGAAGNRVSIDGVPVVVLSGSADEIRIRVPDTTVFPCRPERDVSVRVASGGQVREQRVRLRVGAKPALLPGEAMLVSDPATMACLELEPDAAYALTVVNTSTTLSAESRFVLHGHGSATAAAPSLAAGSRAMPMALPEMDGASPAGAAHDAVLEANRRMLEQVPLAAATVRSAAAFSVAAAPTAPRVGDRVRRSIAVLDSGQFGSCTQFVSVDARVAHVGPRTLILEELNAPTAGRLDSLYEALAAEFEARMLPVLARNFGAIDAFPVERDGRVEMLFSRRVNGFGAAGFVWTGDMIAPANCAASNGSRIMYLGLPADIGGIAAWWRTTPATVVHEAKHLVSYSERLARRLGAQDSWLEEATARVAEEIWGREAYGYVQGGNTTAAQAGCALRAPAGTCAGHASAVGSHFAHLRDVFRSPERRTPFGNPGGDLSFYGSAWWLVRYAADQSGRPESEFLRALVVDARRGVENLAAQAGMPIDELLGHWSLATLLDDRPDVVAADARHRHPSWHSRSVLTAVSGGFPLAVQTVGGTFEADVPALRAGASWYAEIAAGGGQVVSLGNGNGAAPGSTLRLGVARLR